jgi:ubiquitin carboxyl-terminal hydrolase 7
MVRLAPSATWKRELTMSIDDVLWDLVTPSRDDITLGMDHAMKSRGLWGKTDSIFIR